MNILRGRIRLTGGQALDACVSSRLVWRYFKPGRQKMD